MWTSWDPLRRRMPVRTTALVMYNKDENHHSFLLSNSFAGIPAAGVMATFDSVYGTVCNAEQYSQSQALSAGDYSGPSISCLTHGETIGLALTAEASLISSISIIVIFIWIGWNVRWYRKAFPNGDWKLFHGPVDIYMFSLFVFDFLQAIGGILNIKWAHNGIVTDGHFCTAQGLIEQIGDLGVALITLFLAVHTFIAAVWQVGLNARGVALSLVCLACIFITLWVTIGAVVHNNYETPTPYWCWISPQFSRDRLAGEYIWMWIALFASAILYIPLYFWAEEAGNIGNASLPLGILHRRPSSLDSTVVTVQSPPCSSAATFFTVSLFYLSGAINVLLFLVIRPELLLFPRPEEQAGRSEPDIEIVQSINSATFPDIAKFHHSPEPTSTTLGDGNSRNSAALSHVGSRRMSDDI
ncbi:hypothetical protein BGY98DRAFT_1187699 [Russula aff. rugulosa BPL654]|nr:hypothetical protein BGY98DRAFT_1187699 [Russula aff. rugulosa BPL654]